MAKITEKLLLEKGSPQTSKVEQIHSLNLSKLGLRTEDLPVGLMSRLVALERLDLSRNRLTEFPRALALPALAHLDLSDNQVEDVTSLGGLSAVEELSLEDNLYVTVSDNYKLMVLLPRLRTYNGKDITATANHQRYVYSDSLRTRILSVWQRGFSLPRAPTADKMAALEAAFVGVAKQQVRFGPSSISDFTKWRVGVLAAEFLKSLTQRTDGPQTDGPQTDGPQTDGPQTDGPQTDGPQTDGPQTDGPQTDGPQTDGPQTDGPQTDGPQTDGPQTDGPQTDGPQTESSAEDPESAPPRKRRRAPSPDAPVRTPVRTPVKVALMPSPVRESPRKAGLKLTPRKNQTSSAPQASTPSRGPMGGRGTRPSRERVRLTPKSPAKAPPPTPKTKQEQGPVTLRTLHVLQCHSQQDSPDDLSTQLWACAFQPVSSGGSSRLVATCGGESLCLIDCEAGVVMKKYKVPGEEFFALAWSTVLMCCGNATAAQPCSILVAGGKRGVVKLLHPRNNMAYGEFRASRKPLSILHFNPNNGSFLYTGSYDNKIVMWDIGGLDSQYNYKVVQLMSLDCSSTPLHLCVPPKAPLAHLLTACDNGLHCFSNPLPATPTTRWRQTEVTFPVYEEEDPEHDYHTVDGLAFLSDDVVASKHFLHRSIYLWSLSRTLPTPTKKSRTVSAVVLAELQWTHSQVPYLGLSTCPGRAYVVCGDDKGRLWTYHVSDVSKSPAPTVLQWPGPCRGGGAPLEGASINAVSMDPELRYLVALTDKNMVLVWKSQGTS